MREHLLLNNIFEENTAKLEGGAIKRKARNIKKISNTFINNSAVYGPDEASIPVRIMLKVYKKQEANHATKDEKPIYSSYFNSERLRLTDLNSGDDLNLTFYFYVVDYYNETVATLDGG